MIQIFTCWPFTAMVWVRSQTSPFEIFKIYFVNQPPEYKVFYKLMGWLWVKLVDVLAS